MSDAAATAIILAAGKGTRMRSDLPKVMHRLASQPLLGHVLGIAKEAGIAVPALVLAPGMESVAVYAERIAPDVRLFVQTEQRGTADAVAAAEPAIEAAAGPILVLYGDTPLLQPETLNKVTAALRAADLAVVGFETEDPTGYGRLLRDPHGDLVAIREESEANADERAIRLCNSGIMGFRSGEILLALLGKIGNDNSQGEFYLTDAIGAGVASGLKPAIVTADAETVLGINSRAELAAAETILQHRLRAKALAGGATLTAPETVFFSADTEIGRDVTIEPNVFFGPGVSVADGVVIKAFSHIEAATIGEGATVGPFARLRPGAVLAASAHIGNFVEIKKASVGEGAKVNHLTYIGDASIGAGANIGAGTITCNYDGFGKYKTEIGEGAFIGSNSSLVAPVKIGADAYIGSGSVITKDVTPGALALSRAPQDERADWATRFRARRARVKQQDGAHADTNAKVATKATADIGGNNGK